MEKLAENLVALRKSHGFTQNDISQKMFVSRQAVSKWERGETVPDLVSLSALSQLYGITLDDLVKKDLTQQPVFSENKQEPDFDEVKNVHKKQLIARMIFTAISLLGVYALICGIIQTACFIVEKNIWLIWFTLPIVPPLVFAAIFRHHIGKQWLMFFFNVPFASGLIFEAIVLCGNSDGAWISFLLIPVYYSIAAVFYIFLRRQTSTQPKPKQ